MSPHTVRPPVVLPKHQLVVRCLYLLIINSAYFRYRKDVTRPDSPGIQKSYSVPPAIGGSEAPQSHTVHVVTSTSDASQINSKGRSMLRRKRTNRITL